jgi:Mg-chelatase subunit ChlD
MKITHYLAGLLMLAGSSFAAQAAVEPPQERVEVVFVLDTTGSMADLIEGAKRKIWSIASTIVDTNPDADIAMGLVAYRDRGDDYVVQTTELSEDLQGIYGKLTRLQADGGDDTPESVNAALDAAVSDMHWTEGRDVKRIVFLVGDAPPHMDYPQERQYPRILKDARRKEIIVNTVQAGDMPETTEVWKEVAQYGNGRYMAIPQSGGEVVVIVSPYDEDILELQGELDATVLPYGNGEMQLEFKQKMSEKAAAAPSVQLDNSSYYSKRSKTKEVITGRGDLIGDIRNKRVELDGIADAELPKEMQSLPKPKREAWLNDRITKRADLERRMQELVGKRDAHVMQERARTARSGVLDSFDKAIEDTLKSQLN